DQRGEGEGYGVGLEQARGIGDVAGDAADDAEQGGEHQDVASGIPAADFELVVVGDGGVSGMGLAHGVISERRWWFPPVLHRVSSGRRAAGLARRRRWPSGRRSRPDNDRTAWCGGRW